MKNKDEQNEVNLIPIEVLCEECKTPKAIYAAIKVAKGWAEGKQITREEYESAVKEWLNSSIKGKVK